MSCWIYSKPDRLAALAKRCADLADHLHRERCDAPTAARKAVLSTRRVIVLARRRKLLDCARIIRRDRRREALAHA